MKRNQSQRTLFECFGKRAACPVNTVPSGDTTAAGHASRSEREPECEEATAALSAGREGEPDAIAVPGKGNSRMF